MVSSSLLGLTVGCAQCHEHKHDRIPQAICYRMRAIFEPGFDLPRWRLPAKRLVSLMNGEERAKAAEVDKEAKVVDVERKVKEDEFIEKALLAHIRREAPPEVRRFSPPIPISRTFRRRF